MLCFGKAKDKKKETIAKGKLAEEEGRKCEAQGDDEQSRHHFEAAIEHFLAVDFLREAVTIYARLGRYHEAAGWSLLVLAQFSTNIQSLDLLHEHGLLGPAAEYYVKAKHYKEAANCYHCDGQHDQAAAVLRQGGHFDQLVAYVRV